MKILSNFSRLAAGKNRKHYINELKGYIRTYYDYNEELIDHFLTFLNPNEMVQLIEANESQRPLTIRVNTLKTRRKELAYSLQLM
ncbi:MAG: hypothetical protein JST59_00375 [Actinobacteria bacterium]|nr:hypothetical protein [Actinomycetota bacterium]